MLRTPIPLQEGVPQVSLAYVNQMARRTCFREQYYTGTRDIMVAGKIAGQDQPKLYIKIGWLFVHISGSMCSFGLASCVVQENISLLQWIAAGSSRKSIRERLGEVKVSSMMRNSWFFMVWGRLTRPNGPLMGQCPKGAQVAPLRVHCASVLRDGRGFFV